MNTDANVQHWLERSARREADGAGEPAWLQADRKAAMTRFGELGFPGRKWEAWKYTRTESLAKLQHGPAAALSASSDALEALGLPLAGRPRITFLNGRLAPALCDLAPLPPDVTVAGLQQLLAEDSEALAQRWPGLGAFQDHPFAALTAGLWSDGAFVKVPADVRVEPPVLVLFLTDAEATSLHPRLWVQAERGSQLDLVEVHAALSSGAYLTLPLTQVRVEENAGVDHLRLQLDAPEASHIGCVHGQVERSARYVNRSISLGARLARHDVVATLEAEGADATLDGLYLTTDGQHVDHQTEIDHRQPHGSSRELYKGVLAGASRAVFRGRVVVRPDAQKSDARQRNENLLLSERAEIDSKPELEIHADDVRCSHGSTIGQLDADALFYLRSRGLAAPAATALLIRGFASQITHAIADAPLRDAIETRVVELLGGAAP